MSTHQKNIYHRRRHHEQERRANLGTSTAQISSNEELAAIVHQFQPGLDYAFGYGSGVFRQSNNGIDGDDTNSMTSPSMIDIILAVHDPLSWHKRNMNQHSNHYSTLARLGGARFVSHLQLHYGAKVYFHPFVDISINIPRTTFSSQRTIKYGVVSTNDLIHDLLHWDFLYLAGRMHKPIVPIQVTTTEKNDGVNETHVMTNEVEKAQQVNLLSAVSASLLLQHSSSVQLIPISQLYNSIASLSYTGDFRMRTGAEDPNKIKKLVDTPGMIERWDFAYSETLHRLQRQGLLNLVMNDNHLLESHLLRGIEINLIDKSTRKELVKYLPLRLQKHSDSIVGSNDNAQWLERSVKVLRAGLVSIVSPPAKSQSVKGFVSAGVGKSWKYALAKLAKGRLRR